MKFHSAFHTHRSLYWTSYGRTNSRSPQWPVMVRTPYWYNRLHTVNTEASSLTFPYKASYIFWGEVSRGGSGSPAPLASSTETSDNSFPTKAFWILFNYGWSIWQRQMLRWEHFLKNKNKVTEQKPLLCCLVCLSSISLDLLQLSIILLPFLGPL